MLVVLRARSGASYETRRCDGVGAPRKAGQMIYAAVVLTLLVVACTGGGVAPLHAAAAVSVAYVVGLCVGYYSRKGPA